MSYVRIVSLLTTRGGKRGKAMMMKSSLHTAVGVLAVFLMAGSVSAQEPIEELEVDLGPTDLIDLVRR